MTNTMPDVLYHYTSTQALTSIIQNRCLWLAGRWNLNDSNEGLVFTGHLRTYARSIGVDETRVSFVLECLSALEAYVCCFSANGDLLSQWRGYATNGAGVSIGFRKTCLIELLTGDTRCLLRPVAYVDNIADVDGETIRLMDAMLKSSGTPSPEFTASAAKKLWEMKNCAFQEEEEYRIIHTPALDDLVASTLEPGTPIRRKHRAVETGLREYFEVDLSNVFQNVIAEVVLGPKCDSQLGVVQRFMCDNGLPSVTVRKSSASYR